MAGPLYAFRRDDARRIKASLGSTETGGIGGKAKLLPQSDPGTGPFLYTLTSAMGASDGTADVRLMDDSEEVEANATVINTLGDFTGLPIGERGICVRVAGAYYAIHPEDGTSSTADAGGLIFTLTSDMADGYTEYADAQVLVSGVLGVSVSDPIVVRNTGGKQSFISNTGWAMKVDGEYWIVEIGQYALHSRIVFDDPTHDFYGINVPDSVASQNTITTTTFEAISEYPNAYLPFPRPTITNPHNLIGLSGDEGLVFYNAVDDEFQLVAVYPQFWRAFRFQLNANMVSTTVTSVTAFDIVQPLEPDGGDIPSVTSLTDIHGLVIGGRDGDWGIAEYNWVTGDYDITSFKRRPVQMQVSGYEFQISHDGGATWTTWATGEACP